MGRRLHLHRDGDQRLRRRLRPHRPDVAVPRRVGPRQHRPLRRLHQGAAAAGHRADEPRLPRRVRGDRVLPRVDRPRARAAGGAAAPAGPAGGHRDLAAAAAAQRRLRARHGARHLLLFGGRPRQRRRHLQRRRRAHDRLRPGDQPRAGAHRLHQSGRDHRPRPLRRPRHAAPHLPHLPVWRRAGAPRPLDRRRPPRLRRCDLLLLARAGRRLQRRLDRRLDVRHPDSRRRRRQHSPERQGALARDQPADCVRVQRHRARRERPHEPQLHRQDVQHLRHPGPRPDARVPRRTRPDQLVDLRVQAPLRQQHLAGADGQRRQADRPDARLVCRRRRRQRR